MEDNRVTIIADETIETGDMLSMFWDEFDETFKARRLSMEDTFVCGIAEHGANKGESIRVITH